MVQEPEEKYEQRLRYLQRWVDEGEISETDAERIRTLCHAFDDDVPTVKRPRWEDAPAQIRRSREKSTLARWVYDLAVYARHISLTDATPEDVNHVAEQFRKGTSPIKSFGTLSKTTCRQYQHAVRIFYRYHDDLDVAPHDITVFEAEDNGFDPRDALASDEVEVVRDASTEPRDQAIVDLLLYTGLRNTALRTLRVKDVDLDEGVYYYNTEADGLKNVYQPRSARTLLGAENAVRDWLKYHPEPEPDAYLLTAKPKYNKVDPYNSIGARGIQYVMESIKEEAGISKPLHPHMMRHNFVTICKRDYDMPDDTVRFLIGHAPDSKVMESTYAHLSGEDHNKKAEIAAGRRDESEAESPFTPDFCEVCGEPLGERDKACARCGTVYTPDAQSSKEQIDASMKESYRDADPADDETMEKIDTLDDLLDDPEVKAALLDKLNE